MPQNDPDAEDRADRSFANACIAIGLVVIFAIATAMTISAFKGHDHRPSRPQVRVIGQQV